ncbi:hypothetical protein M3Y97_00243600 [Aphelenchoides bicaudatus]|nr:hypothetical protein M3Y97_00243600 [Aphelenchoides bicaudatus]
MVERKKEPARGLVASDMFRHSTEKSTPTSGQARTGPIKNRPPYVMPSAPIKPGSNRIAMTPAAQQRSTSMSNRFGGSMSNLSGEKEECHCQHPADIEFLQDVYLENMRIRVQMLELENKCLKGETVEEEATSSNTRGARTSVNKKRVEFADRRLFGSTSSDSPEKQPISRQVTQQTSSDQELFDKLEEAYQKEFKYQEKIKALTMENRKIAAARDELEKHLNRINSGERKEFYPRSVLLMLFAGTTSREKHVLMEDNFELQRRLDDLTPLLAAKDAEIERLEMEKSTLIAKIRRLSTGTATKQDRESNVRESNIRELSTSTSSFARSQELAFKEETIEKLEQQLRQKERDFNDEIASLKRRLKEEQMLIKREQSLRENYAQENDKLTKENSELASKLDTLADRHERERHADAENRVSKAQLAELKDKEEQMLNDILALEKRLKSETEGRRTLEDQLRRQEHEETQTQNSRRKIQEELQALQALSDSLSAENQGLRQEKLSITQRIEMLFEKLEDKEKEIRQLTQMLEDFQQQFIQTVDRLRAEMQKQIDTGGELDRIVRHARQISSNFSQSGSSARMSSIKEVTLEQNLAKSPKTPARRRIEEDEITKSERSSRQSSVAEEISEKDARPVLSPITSPTKSKPSSLPPTRQTQNRSLRTLNQTERSISRAYSEDRQSTASSLAQKYRRKMS